MWIFKNEALRLPRSYRDVEPWAAFRPASRRFALGGSVEAETFAHPSAESFPFLRRHQRPSLRHAIDHAIGHSIGYPTPDSPLRATVESKSAKEDPAQRQNSERLPKRNLG